MGFMQILKILFKKAISFLVFMIALMCLNILIPLLNSNIFTAVVWFLNSNILIVFMATLFLLFGEVFDELIFPTNLPGPLLNAVGSLFIMTFILRMIYFISDLSAGKISLNLQSVYGFIYLFVFLAVLLAGYLDIIQNMPEKGGLMRRTYAAQQAAQEERDEQPEEERPIRAKVKSRRKRRKNSGES